jgi:hypothetical protein
MKRRRLVVVAGAALLAFSIAGGQQQQPPNTPTPEAKRKGEQPPKSPRKRVVTDLSGFDLLESKKVEKQTLVVGATRGFPQPIALAPRLGKVYGLNPTFAWSYEGKAQRFVFVLLDDAQAEVFRSEITGTGFRYPQTAPPLEPGKTYFWTVEVSSALTGGGQSSPVGFIVLSAAQRAEIKEVLTKAARADPYADGVARARVLTEHRLWYDTIAAYSELITRYPDRAELYEQRGMVYAQLDVTKPQADADFARAEELQHDVPAPK